MRTILKLVRWFGKALDRDGLGWSAMFGASAAAFIFGCMSGCFGVEVVKGDYESKIHVFRKEAVRRGAMEVWRTPDGENVYRWKDEPPKERR